MTDSDVPSAVISVSRAWDCYRSLVKGQCCNSSFSLLDEVQLNSLHYAWTLKEISLRRDLHETVNLNLAPSKAYTGFLITSKKISSTQQACRSRTSDKCVAFGITSSKKKLIICFAVIPKRPIHLSAPIQPASPKEAVHTRTACSRGIHLNINHLTNKNHAAATKITLRVLGRSL